MSQSSTPVSYSRGCGLGSPSGDRLSRVRFKWFSSIAAGKCGDILNYATTALFHIVYISFFQYSLHSALCG